MANGARLCLQDQPQQSGPRRHFLRAAAGASRTAARRDLGQLLWNSQTGSDMAAVNFSQPPDQPLPMLNSRREFLWHAWNGIGALALSGLLADDAPAAAIPPDPSAALPPHFPRRARHCIFLFMQGGVS